MKHLITVCLIALLLLGCSVNNSGKTVTRKTDNPNLPIIYKNGYKDFTVKAHLTIQDNDTTYINELRFNAVESALYTQKLMYDRFGKWSNEINQANYTYPTLVWENVMLFDNENKRYTVAANGTESYENMFAAVMVYDADNNDCFSPNSPEKEKIISYFSKGIKNLSKSEKFYVLFQQKFGVK